MLSALDLNRDYNRDPNIKVLKRKGSLIMGLHQILHAEHVVRSRERTLA